MLLKDKCNKSEEKKSHSPDSGSVRAAECYVRAKSRNPSLNQLNKYFERRLGVSGSGVVDFEQILKSPLLNFINLVYPLLSYFHLQLFSRGHF